MKTRYWVALAIVILIVCFTSSEEFRACMSCDSRLPAGGITVVNPFVYPYSATANIDDLYIKNRDLGPNVGLTNAPLYSLNTPDHVEMI